jgi:hypothetical protein
MVRLLSAGGMLKPVDGHAWAGNGTGRNCAVCSNPATPMEVEYEVGGDARAHTRCFLVRQDPPKNVPETNQLAAPSGRSRRPSDAEHVAP